MQSYVAQLKKPEVRAKFKTIVIDTLDEMAWYAEQHILQSFGVNALGDIPYGKGYTELGKMFKSIFNELIKFYGVIVIGHSKERQDPDNEDLKFFGLTVNNTVKAKVMPTFDIMAFVQSGRSIDDPRIMHFRGSERWEAKSRFAGIAPSVEFSYENLVKAIQDAVGEEGVAVEHKDYYETADEVKVISEKEFNTLKEEVLKLGNEKITNGKVSEVQAIVEKTVGTKKIKDLTKEDYHSLQAIKQELELI